MASGFPVRLSGPLTVRARASALLADRSLTEQVEHWARLGQAVEAAVLAATVERLKARSHDPDLEARIAFANTAEGRAKAAKLIRERSAVLHGTTGDGPIRIKRRRAPRSKRG